MAENLFAGVGVGTALLTGATGTVGAAPLDRLLRDGRSVRCLVRDASNLAGRSGLEVVAGDIGDAKTVENAMQGCTTVFHIAGTPQQWTRDPSIYQRSNVEGTRHVLAACERQGVAPLLYASTQDTLDQTLDPFDEASVNHDPNPSPYERSKIEAQRLVDAAALRGLHTCSLHLVAVFGASPRRISGVNALIFGLAKGLVPMLPPGGLPLVYDQDAADAFIRAEASAPAGSRFLVADRDIRCVDLARRIDRITGKPVPGGMSLPVARVFAGLGDLVAAVVGRAPKLSRVDLRAFTHSGKPSSERIRSDLGWKPTDLDEALASTIAAWNSRGQG